MSNPYIPQESYNQDSYTLPGFQPERVEDIYEHITTKYYAQEPVVSNSDQFTTLTWKIQQPDLNMVWKSVRVVIPVKIKALLASGDAVSTHLSDKLPASNVALSAHMQKAFTDIQLSINGKIFTINPSSYQELLDVCYMSKDADSFPSNHSLKPNASRNLQSGDDVGQNYPLIDPNGNILEFYTHIGDIPTRASDHAFDLSFANGPFVERVRDWQRILNRSGDESYTANIGFNLQVGPFMDRARARSNKAVPFIRDFSLRMRWDRSVSQFDVEHTAVSDTNVMFPNRTLCNGLLEWGTPVNLKHAKEAHLPMQNWASGGFSVQIIKKPHLQVQYVKMGGLAPSYTLRALDYRYEKSNAFRLIPPRSGYPMNSDVKTAVVNTRLTSFPSKVYLWLELADGYKRPFFMGGTYRYGRLENIKLRINQRTNVVDAPTNDELFEQFKLLTANGLEKPTWAKSPVYVFSCDTFGQPDMKSGDGVVSTFEWRADCELSELFCEELVGLQELSTFASMGYSDGNIAWGAASVHNGVTCNITRFGFDYHPWTYAMPPGPQSRWQSSNTPLVVHGTSQYLHPRDSIISIEKAMDRVATNPTPYTYCPWDSMQPSNYTDIFCDKRYRQVADPRLVADRGSQNREQFRVQRVLDLKYRYDGLVWAVVDMDTTYYPSTHARIIPFHGNHLWYVPESYWFDFDFKDIYEEYDNQQTGSVVRTMKQIFNPISSLTWVPVNGADPAHWEVANPRVITGHIQSRDFANGQTEDLAGHTKFRTKRIKFNDEYNTCIDGWVPGNRAYPVLATGIELDALNDGYNHTTNLVVDMGGLPARPATRLLQQRADREFGFNCIDVAMPGAAPAGQQPNVGNLRWVAFQFNQSAVTGNPTVPGVQDPDIAMSMPRQATPVRNNFHGGQQIPNGDQLPCGWAQDQRPLTVGTRLPYAARQVIAARCSVERHLMNERTEETIDLKQGYVAAPGHAGDTHYNWHHRLGSQLQFASNPQQRTIADNLQYELKCLYEFGEQQYLFKNNGEKPVKYNNIIADAGMDSDDPRLKRKDTLLAPPMNSGVTYS